MPRAIIIDRNRNFTSEMWRGMMERLGVKLLFSTAWHPQTDGASERSNQTIEIALRYFIATLVDIKRWPEGLPSISSTLSNSSSRGTRQTATAVMFGERIRESLDIAAESIVDLAHDDKNQGPSLSHQAVPIPAYPVAPANAKKYKPAMIEVIDKIKFAAMYVKRQYDAKHQAKSFKVGDFVYLRLHTGYDVPGLSGRNVTILQQLAGPFRVIERIGRLSYCLDLPPSISSEISGKDGRMG